MLLKEIKKFVLLGHDRLEPAEHDRLAPANRGFNQTLADYAKPGVRFPAVAATAASRRPAWGRWTALPRDAPWGRPWRGQSARHRSAPRRQHRPSPSRH